MSLTPEDRIFGDFTETIEQKTNEHQFNECANVVNPAYEVYFCDNQCGCYKKVYENGKIEYGSVSKTIDPEGSCPNK